MDVLPQSLQAGGECPSTISTFPPEARFSCVLEITQEKGQAGKKDAALYCYPAPCITALLSVMTAISHLRAGKISTFQVLEGNPRHEGTQ